MLGPRHQFPLGSPAFPLFLFYETTTDIIEAGLWECNIGWSPVYQLRRLQSVMDAAARLVFSASRYDQIMPLLHRLQWLRAPQ